MTLAGVFLITVGLVGFVASWFVDDEPGGPYGPDRGDRLAKRGVLMIAVGLTCLMVHWLGWAGWVVLPLIWVEGGVVTLIWNGRRLPLSDCLAVLIIWPIDLHRAWD